MRLAAKLAAAIALVFTALCLGLITAGSGLLVARVTLLLIPAASLETAFIVGAAAAFRLAIWSQIELMAFARPRIARLERWMARGLVITYEQVAEPFLLLLRSFTDDTLIATKTPGGPAAMFSDNRFEPWILKALRRIGPIIAVGKPDEPLPHTGARRLYIHHETWTEVVET